MKTKAISILLILLMIAASFVGCSSSRKQEELPAVSPHGSEEPAEITGGIMCHDDTSPIVEINLGDGVRTVDYNKAIREADIVSAMVHYADVVLTRDLNVVESRCDSILIGKVVEKEQHFKNTSSTDGTTITTIQVEKIFSGPADLTVGAQVRLWEGSFLFESANGELVLQSNEPYFPLMLNGHYLLFLHSVPQEEQIDWSEYKTQPVDPSIQFFMALVWLSKYRVSPETYDMPAHSLSMEQVELNAESEMGSTNYFELFDQVKSKYFTDPFVASLVDALRTAPPTP